MNTNAWKICPLDATFKKNGTDSVLHGPALIYMASPPNPHLTGDCLRIDYSTEGPIDAEALAAEVRAEIAATAEAKCAELPSVAALNATLQKLANATGQRDRLSADIQALAGQLQKIEEEVPTDAASQIAAIETKKSQAEKEHSIADRLVRSLYSTRDRLLNEVETEKRTALENVRSAKRAALSERRQALLNELTKDKQTALSELASVVAKLGTV